MCDWAEVYEERFRRARKDHVCGECDRTIRDGERYRYASGIFDGIPFDTKTCVRCARLVDLVNAKWGAQEACLVAGGVFGFLDENVHPGVGDRLRERSRRDEVRPLEEMERLFPAPVSETTT